MLSDTSSRSYSRVPQSAAHISAVTRNRRNNAWRATDQFANGLLAEVRQQKDQAGALPRVLSALFNPLANESDQRLEEIYIIRSNSVPQSVVSIQFVDDGDVSKMFEDHKEVQIDEYETDSDDEETENEYI